VAYLLVLKFVLFTEITVSDMTLLKLLFSRLATKQIDHDSFPSEDATQATVLINIICTFLIIVTSSE